MRRKKPGPRPGESQLAVPLGRRQWQVLYVLACFDLRTTRIAAGITLKDLCQRNGLDYATMAKLEDREVVL